MARASQTVALLLSRSGYLAWIGWTNPRSRGSELAQNERMDHPQHDFSQPYNQPFPEELDEAPGDVADRRLRRGVANRAFRAIKAQRNAQRDWIEVVADWLNYLASSTPFLVAHAIWFFGWILWNTGAIGLRPFDPFPFGLLTMIVSLEAIFLSIFVLMAQRRESAIAEMREEISLQVSLRLEEEVTKTLQLVAGLYTRLGHRMAEDEELRQMLQPLDVEAIERELALQIQAASRRKGQ
jgi:uncharacterized membrane protein